METVNNVNCCEHRRGVALWVRNDGQTAPSVFVDLKGPTVLILTNQTIYLRCAACFKEASLPVGAISRLDT